MDKGAGMQRTLSLNSREFELVVGSLTQLSTFIQGLPWSCSDEKRNYKEEIEGLIKRLKQQGDESVGGVYIDGVRQ